MVPGYKYLLLVLHAVQRMTEQKERYPKSIADHINQAGRELPKTNGSEKAKPITAVTLAAPLATLCSHGVLVQFSLAGKTKVYYNLAVRSASRAYCWLKRSPQPEATPGAHEAAVRRLCTECAPARVKKEAAEEAAPKVRPPCQTCSPPNARAIGNAQVHGAQGRVHDAAQSGSAQG